MRLPGKLPADGQGTMRAGDARAGDVRAAWFAAVLVVLAGYVFVFRADEARIDERLADNERVAAQLVAGERALRARDARERERTALRERLHQVDLAGDRTAVAARFVRDAARIAARRRTTITAIAAEGRTQPRTAGDFDSIPLTLTVEGRYRDVLATVGALSAGRVLATVEVASLARKQAGSADATLSAQVRVTLERLAPIERLAPTETPDARTRPA